MPPAPAVALLHWPDEEGRRAELERLGIPRLLLVQPDASPPPAISPDEDWLRLPADEADVRARVTVLAQAPGRPTIDEFGVLTFDNGWVALSPIDEAIMRRLVQSFGTIVPRDAILSAAWDPETRSSRILDTHMHRLRIRIAPVGLSIHTIRRRGFVLTATASQEPTWPIS